MVQRFQITKTIEFSYGHRLLNHEGKCRHLHGHNGLVEVDVEAEAVDRLGMVIDFADVNDVVKTWIDENLDHRMLLSGDDPATPILEAAGEPVFVMAENPTAENIAKLIWTASRNQGLQVAEVRVWETLTSRAAYKGDGWSE